MDKAVNNDMNVNARLEHEYKGYNLFNHIDDKRLQAWNRLNTALNILANPKEGAVAHGNYLAALGKDGMLAVQAMGDEVRRRGFEPIKQELLKSVQA